MATLSRLVLLAVLLTLAACAAAVPGYTPPPQTESKNKFAKPLDSGSVGSDGLYHMSETEKAMDCKRMMGSMQITISRLKDSYGRAEPSELSSMTHSTFGPMIGASSVGSDRQAVYARERAKLEAYNSELGEKGCATLDIEAELARPAEPPRKY